ncbi:MAG TPA: Uma2 family endonuclease [Tepidisphaeraceae bacterium]|jgi:Uma2 family endonuclease|nr:Uma2 family endonuclease [Tepidisphaeraceae bacterium]
MTVSLPRNSLVDQQHIVLDDVSWKFYEHLLDEVGDRPLRITYDNGSIEIMAPLDVHEYWKKRIGQLVELMCLERDIKVLPAGSTTFKREDLQKGLEPDECYYIQHADAVPKEGGLDLAKDPPPDLAIEIDITSRSIERQPVYAALGVGELWRFDGRRLTVLRLDAGGQYAPRDASGVFPFLPMDEFNRFLRRFESEEHNTVVRAFRDWVIGLPQISPPGSNA